MTSITLTASDKKAIKAARKILKSNSIASSKQRNDARMVLYKFNLSK